MPFSPARPTGLWLPGFPSPESPPLLLLELAPLLPPELAPLLLPPELAPLLLPELLPELPPELPPLLAPKDVSRGREIEPTTSSLLSPRVHISCEPGRMMSRQLGALQQATMFRAVSGWHLSALRTASA